MINRCGFPQSRDAHAAKAGYHTENWNRLERDIRSQLLTLEAVFVEDSQLGIVYEKTGKLNGPNNKSLKVRSIWMKEYESEVTMFITMYPVKE